MSFTYPAGILSKTPVTPEGPYAQGAASGVWKLNEVAYWIKQGLWPNASNPAPNDPYFQYVTSLLHGDGTNGGQNNTFLDSSTNAFTITRNGNTTQGSFSPYGSNWGNYFGGSSTYLTVPNNAAYTFPGDFTIEMWYLPNDSAVQSLFDYRGVSTENGNDPAILKNASNKIQLYIDGNYQITSAAIGVGTWNHIAVCRSGSTITMYLNGISQGTYSYASQIQTSGANRPIIGAFGYTPGTYSTVGYISNLRLVKGTAVYTSNFTPSTTPLTAISGTSLLTCQSNRFVDTSTTAATITVTGTPQVTRFSPFAPTYATQYSASTIGGSGYFDGSGDYLTVAGTSQFQFGTGDFTIEYWVYPTALDCVPVGQTYNASAYAIQPFINSGTGSIELAIGATSNTTSNGAVVLNQWNHVAIVRSGTTLQVLTNGTSKGSWTYSSNAGDNATMGIGARPSGNYLVNGYVSNVRIVKGTALYSGSTYTIPTAPLTAVANTSLLCNMTNGAIYDNAEVADYETVGNAQISTSVKKYGTGSLAFDGASDYLKAPNSRLYDLGSGNFTLEFWVYHNSITSPTYQMYCGQFNAGGNTPGWNIYKYTNGSVQFYGPGGTPTLTSPNILTASNWYHIAVTRAGSTMKMFINGTEVANTTNTSFTDETSNSFYIGSRSDVIGTYDMNGYIDDLRITKGYARYWENFTPPAAALPNFGGAYQVPTQDPQFNYTTLLLPGNGTNGAQNNTFLDSSTNAFTITRNGNTTQGTFTPFSQTGWGTYFPGSSTFTPAANNGFLFGTSDFTIEFWINPSSFTSGGENFVYFGDQVLVGHRPGGFGVRQSGTADLLLVTDPPIGQWTHVAVTRTSGTLRIFYNGTQQGSVANSTNFNSGNNLSIGGSSSGQYSLTGYVSNLRVVNGTSLYSSNFTPSTTPLTAVSGTQLLTCQSNRFIDNSTNALSITIYGSPSVQAFSPFAPTAAYSASTVGGSGYFDGNGDYLSVADNAAFALGTNNFTVDGWAWIDSNSSQGVIIAQDTGTASTSSFRVEWDGTINGRVYIGGTQYTLTGTSDRRNTWVHFALVRNGSTVYLYVNGVQEATASVSTGSINDSSAVLTIGATSTGGTRPTGYISNVRLVNGTAVYTTAFTPPTAPTTAVTNTALLVNFTNAAITDATAKNDVETSGTAQISTTQSKFGGSSVGFTNSSTSALYWKSLTNQMYFGAGDFTVEFWLYPDGSQTTGAYLATTRASTFSLGSGAWEIRFASSNAIRTQVRPAGGTNDYSINSSGTITIGLNTWTHVALVRYGNTLTLYQNGQAIGSNTLTSSDLIGVNDVNGFGLDNFAGYINDLRITKGYARYVQPFTPPAQADQLY